MSQSPWSSIKRFWSSSLGMTTMFVGYMGLIHYGWHKLQYSPVVNNGEKPASLSLEKFQRAFLGAKRSEEK